MHWWSKSVSVNGKTKSRGSLADILRSRTERDSGSSSASPSPKGRDKGKGKGKGNGFSPKAQGHVNGPHLTRTRKLRHLSDEEVATSTPSPSYGSGRPVPLPLPSPKQGQALIGEEFALAMEVDGDGERGWDLPSSDESEESFEGGKSNELLRHVEIDVDAKAADNTSFHGPSFIDINRKSPEQALAQSAQFVLGPGGQPFIVRKGVQRDVSSRLHLNLKLGGVAKSAPTTVLSSPALSPRRLSSGDFLPSRNIKTTQGRDPGISLSVPSLGQNLMAETMMQPMSDKVFASPDRSPLQSPRLTSPYTRSRIHSGAVSPLHPSFSTGLHDDGANVSVHRLPLPPGNASPVGPVPSTNSPFGVVQRSSLRAETSITPGKWKKGKLLGRGTFGTVYVGFNRETGDMCAMKEVPLIPDDSKSSESIKQLEQEINLLSQLKHPNIVQYYGSETLEDAFYIYLEYVPGGSIFKLLREFGPLPEPVIKIYTRQILSGLAYLHSKNTVHRDIKGANLLADTYGKIKLADFGMAKHINGSSAPLSLKGSPYWMAPELIMPKNTGHDLITPKNTGHDLAVDIWSLGCTVIEMAMGKPPWSEYEGAAAMFKVFKSEVPSIPDTLSAEGKEFIRCCLHRNPAERPTASQLLDHPFVRNSNQQDSDPLASATSRIKYLNLMQSPREKNVNTSDCASIHPGNGKQHQLPSENIYSQIGTSTRSSNLLLSPRSTLEAYSSLSPPHSNITTGGILSGNVGNRFLSSVTNEVPIMVQSSLCERVGTVGMVNIAGHSEFSTDHNWNSPFIRTPEGSPKRRDYIHDDIMQINVSRRLHEFEEDYGKNNDASRFVREIIPQWPLRTPGYPTVYP